MKKLPKKCFARNLSFILVVLQEILSKKLVSLLMPMKQFRGKKPFHKKIQSNHFLQDPASEEEQVVQWELAEAAMLELLDFKAISANYSLRHNLTGMIKKDKIC